MCWYFIQNILFWLINYMQRVNNGEFIHPHLAYWNHDLFRPKIARMPTKVWKYMWAMEWQNIVLYLWYSFNTFSSKRPFNLTRFKFLNSGSVCALYLRQEIIRTARLCNFAKPIILHLHANIVHCRGVLNKEFHSMRRICVIKKPSSDTQYPVL